MDLYRGDVYYVERYPSVGCEQQAGRPAVIVSNDLNNKHSSTVEVVYLTTKPKTDLPTHVAITATGIPSTALCEQVHTIDTTRLGSFCGSCSDDELARISEALMISLDLDMGGDSSDSSNTESEDEITDIEKELTIAKAQLTLMQQLYSELLHRTINRD